MTPTDKQMIDYLYSAIQLERERFEIRIKPYVEQLVKIQERNIPSFWLLNGKLTEKEENDI